MLTKLSLYLLCATREEIFCWHNVDKYNKEIKDDYKCTS